LTHKGHLPPIEEIGKTNTTKHLFEEVQQNMNQIQESAQETTKVRVDSMEDHLTRLTKT